MLPRRARIFEFALTAAFVGSCAYYLLAALQRVEEDAERIIVEATIRNVNTGLRYAQAQLIVQGRENEIAALYGGPPVRWLERPPLSYLELEHAGAADFLPGRWVWDRRAGLLTYTPRRLAGLTIDGASVLQWRWSAEGKLSLRAGLQPVREYRWQPG